MRYFRWSHSLHYLNDALSLPSVLHSVFGTRVTKIVYQASAYFDTTDMALAKTHELVVGERVTRSAVPVHVDVKKTFSMSFSGGELQMSVDLDKDVRTCAIVTGGYSHCFKVFVPGEAIKIHVRVNNQSGRNVRSIKARLVRVVSGQAEQESTKETADVCLFKYPHKVKGNGGVFEGDLDFKFPLDVYPSSVGVYAGCTCEPK